MRKQNIIYKALLAFTMILLLCFTACSDLLNKDLKKKSTVFISLENAGERSVLPVYDFESFKDFKLTGKKALYLRSRKRFIVPEKCGGCFFVLYQHILLLLKHP